MYATSVANQSRREALKSAIRANGKKIVSDRLMTVPEGNTEFCFPRDPLIVSRRKAEGNLEGRGQTKLTVSREISH